MSKSTPDLSAILRKRIKQDGPISVADFMAAALGHPQHGYYNTRDPFGRSGDFITAPEVSQMFGELIGLWAAAAWQIMEQPQNIRFIEMGPGRGTLMADALRAIHQAMPDFCNKLSLDLVDISPVLKKRQNKSLQQWMKTVQINWHDTIDSITDGPSIVIANEFFDALPVCQYEKINEGWCERRIGLDGDSELHFMQGAILEDVSIIPERLRSAPVGQIFESNSKSIHVVEKLCDRLKTQNGICLLLDYGHVRQGLGETVQAVKDQKYHDLFNQPGEADITAHVDFEALGVTAASSGCRVFGPITQKMFLERLGIRTRAEKLMTASQSDQTEAVHQALDRLIGDDEMGTLFKVMAFTDLSILSLPGFE